MNEPVLTADDRAIWSAWVRQALAHARTAVHRARVEKAREVVLRMAARCPQAYVAWSAGKDSTALTHLVCVSCGVPACAMSVKDDLDYPGEREYVEAWAAQWSVAADILTPPFSLRTWIQEHAHELRSDDDFHGRAAEMSARGFYDVIAEYRRTHGCPGVYLGLRAEESRSRARNRYLRGLIYDKADGEAVCTPLADWRGIDVYAYLFAHGVDVLDVYRCVRFHESPDRVRKSWWLPGAATRHGGLVWLRAYYPSLFRQLCEWLPDARLHT